MKLAYDLHGVLDSNVKFFQDFLLYLRAKGHEIIVLSGPPKQELEAELATLGFRQGDHYIEVLSIVDYLKASGVQMWQDNKNTWWAGEDDWWSSKAKICAENNIEDMFDDHKHYRKHFHELGKTRFVLWKPFEHHTILFGGSFNPPHLGHLEKAKAILDGSIFKAAKICFMPVYQHPWDKELVSGQHRLEMLKLAVKDFDDERIQVLPFELERGIVGGTVEVVKQLFQTPEFEGTNLEFLIGQDEADQIHKWKEWEKLILMMPFIVMKRPGFAGEVADPWYMKPPHFTVNPTTAHGDASSTSVRKELAENKSSKNITPSTLEYILENKLYE